MNPTECKRMIGAVIVSHNLMRDGHLLLRCTDGNLHLRPVADGSSETWIEGIDLPGVLRGRILAVEDIPMPQQGDVGSPRHPSIDPAWEEVEYYGLKITTECGVAVIDYRNASNGHYGGDLELIARRT